MTVLGRIVNTKTAILKHLSNSCQTTQLVRRMSMIKFPSENAKGECHGYLQGDVSKTKKGLIVLQEWWGMNDQIKDEAKLIGDLGNFVTLVPDLYRGKIATDNEQANHLMTNLDWPGAISDIQGAARFLLGNGCTKVGVTGFCMGGALSFAAAVKVGEISACAPFYGIPSADAFDVSTIKIPIQAHFGSADALANFSSPKDVQVLKAKFKDRSNFKLYMYEGCGHAFTNPTGPLGNYNKEACDLAFQRLKDFMNSHLADSGETQQKSM